MGYEVLWMKLVWLVDLRVFVGFVRRLERSLERNGNRWRIYSLNKSFRPRIEVISCLSWQRGSLGMIVSRDNRIT